MRVLDDLTNNEGLCLYFFFKFFPLKNLYPKNMERTFFGQGEGVNFWRFCANVFYGRPLIEIV